MQKKEYIMCVMYLRVCLCFTEGKIFPCSRTRSWGCGHYSMRDVKESDEDMNCPIYNRGTPVPSNDFSPKLAKLCVDNGQCKRYSVHDLDILLSYHSCTQYRVNTYGMNSFDLCPSKLFAPTVEKSVSEKSCS